MKIPTNSWKPFLENEMQEKYFYILQRFLGNEEKKQKVIFPKKSEVFSAFFLTPLQDIKVVILGQDPYHGENQAHGLSFSVPSFQKKIPPSLKNIQKEILTEFPHQNLPQNGNLQYLGQQGVFLLNATLTVEKGKAGSHQKKGWEIFTDRVIQEISKNTKHTVFLLWGSFAQQKKTLIDQKQHLILKAPHPSPLSAYRGFFGCNHFIKTNEYLQIHHKTDIQWG